MGGRGRGAYYKEKYGNKGRGGGGGGYGRGGGGYRGGGGGGGYGRGGRGGGYGGHYEDGDQYTSSHDRDRSHGGSSLYDALVNCEGANYKAYKDLTGSWEVTHGGLATTVFIDNVQSDPFAPPSRMRVRLERAAAGYPAAWTQSRIRVVALCDYLARRMARQLSRGGLDQGGGGGGWHGSKGGDIRIDSPSQHVLLRSSVLVTAAWAELRLSVNLPAHGRTCEGYKAAKLVCQHLIEAVKLGVLAESLDRDQVWDHIRSVEDQEAARHALKKQGLVAFVINGAMLPRASGANDTVLKNGGVPFASPPSLEVSLSLPHRGEVRGMGLRAGVTLVVGGGYHGKTTLLEALQVGVYNHVPGDGREFVVTLDTAVKVRAEDGRPVTGLDISPFISNLPQGRDTTSFSTEDASGSTSQAANIMEALEAGTEALLVDEDTCATNFMSRDARMARLVPVDPITPFLHTVTALYSDRGVSTVLVAGSCGDFFDTADTVLCMQEYRCVDMTARAKQICAEMPATRDQAAAGADTKFRRSQRRISMASLQPGGNGKVKADRDRGIMFGDTEIDLSYVEQLVDTSQTRFIMDCLVYLGSKMSSDQSVQDIISHLKDAMTASKLDCPLDLVSPWSTPNGCYTQPRMFEIVAAVNRLRSMRTRN